MAGRTHRPATTLAATPQRVRTTHLRALWIVLLCHGQQPKESPHDHPQVHQDAGRPQAPVSEAGAQVNHAQDFALALLAEGPLVRWTGGLWALENEPVLPGTRAPARAVAVSTLLSLGDLGLVERFGEAEPPRWAKSYRLKTPCVYVVGTSDPTYADHLRSFDYQREYRLPTRSQADVLAAEILEVTGLSLPVREELL